MNEKEKRRAVIAAAVQISLSVWMCSQAETDVSWNETAQSVTAYLAGTLINLNLVWKGLRFSASQKRSLQKGIRGWGTLIALLYSEFRKSQGKGNLPSRDRRVSDGRA